MMRKWLGVFTIALLVLGVTLLGNAQGPGVGQGMGGPGVRGPGGHDGPGGPGGGLAFLRGMAFEKLAVRLQLTPEQKQQIQQIAKDSGAKMAGQAGPGTNVHETLMKQIFTDNPNQADIQKSVQAMLQQHTQMLNQMVATATEINKVLTPEQRVELQKVFNENAQVANQMRQRMRQRMSQPPPPPPQNP